MHKLEWDSKFWGIEIYNIDGNYKFIIPEFNKKQPNGWIIQALVPEYKVEIINELEDKGFRFVETKINLIKKTLSRVNINENYFKEIEHEDIEIYKDDFEILYGEFSRFKLLGSDKIKEFYYIWVINSINGKMDDKCIGYFIQEKLAGFITYKIRNNELTIGLVGVFPQFQRKGIGQQLLNYINNMALNKNYGTINVSTQGKNHHAINSYIKNGYILEDIQNWYYLRGDKS